MGFYRDNGKEDGNYYNGLYRDYRYISGLYVLGRSWRCRAVAGFQLSDSCACDLQGSSLHHVHVLEGVAVVPVPHGADTLKLPQGLWFEVSWV